MSSTSRISLRLGLAAGSVMLLVGCAGAAPATPSATAVLPASAAPVASQVPTATGNPEPTQSPVVFRGNVAVNGSRTVRVRCVGQGTPTILLEAGGTGSNLLDWTYSFVDTLAAQTTTCAYSRAGGNGSAPMSGAWTMAGVVADADALLEGLRGAAGIEGPYLLVGWSFGGAVVLAEAMAHPDRTAGLVILDTDIPNDFLAVCPTSGRTVAECQAIFDGDRDAKVMGREIAALVHPLPGVPIALVSAMRPDPDCGPEPGASQVTYDIDGVLISAPDCVTLLQRIADAGLVDWRVLGDQVVQTRVNATHNGLINEAGDEVAAVILGILAQLR